VRFKALGLLGFLLLGSVIAAEAETIYVASIEHFQTLLATGYKVEARTTDTDPKIDYRLACGLNAGALQTGQRYRVEPSYSGNSRYLTFSDVKTKEGHQLVCDIESEKIAK